MTSRWLTSSGSGDGGIYWRPSTPSRERCIRLPAGSVLTGLPQGTPVHAGPFDFPATCIGGGLHEAGNGLIALGTTLACGVLTDRLDTEQEPSGMTISSRERDRWIRLLPAMAMSALDWFLPLIGVDYQELNALIASGTPGARRSHYPADVFAVRGAGSLRRGIGPGTADRIEHEYPAKRPCPLGV